MRGALPALAVGAWCLAKAQNSSRRQSQRDLATQVVLAAAARGGNSNDADDVPESGNFVEEIVAQDLDKGTHSGRVRTRFPPEPNGFLHIGHAKSICLNFGIANKFNGTCNLRFDDTNPASEKQEYIDSIQEDVKWLGFEWDGESRYASDYFQELYDWAVAFTERGWAYIDELSAEEISELRGTLTTPGKDSPYRDRPVEESLEMLRKMKDGELEQGAAVLRAKIDMAHRNVIMRDPIMYRIIKDTPHPRTGSKWCIYPSYDWAHGLSDAVENVTHSVCTLEFNMHNELYDFFNEKVKSLGSLDCEVLPKQYEFARLEMTNIVVSKRKLKRLVDGGYVSGWDDPRMPTLSGMRRRGFPPAALRQMCELIGVTKVASSVIRYELLESCVRKALEVEAAKWRLLCVLRPLKVVVTNWEGEDEILNAPTEEGCPARPLPFGKELYIEQEDFMEEPEAGFKRLAPGRQVKLRFGYVLQCDEVVKDSAGEIVELRCTYDPESLGKRPPKKAAVVHWAHASASVPVKVRLYDRLFSDERPEEREDFLEALNPNSLEELTECFCEPSVNEVCEVEVAQSSPTRHLQFERCGYFLLDVPDSLASRENGGPLVFNRTVSLRDAYEQKKSPPAAKPRKKQKKQQKKKEKVESAS